MALPGYRWHWRGGLRGVFAGEVVQFENFDSILIDLLFFRYFRCWAWSQTWFPRRNRREWAAHRETYRTRVECTPSLPAIFCTFPLPVILISSIWNPLRILLLSDPIHLGRPGASTVLNSSCIRNKVTKWDRRRNAPCRHCGCAAAGTWQSE